MALILLVDDDPTLRMVLGMSLGDAGHEVVEAQDGREGLARISSHRPEVVICDVNLPYVDGFSVCRQLRAKGDRVPFLLLTSRDDEVDEALGLELGADDYIVKPFSTRVLLARISAVLRRRELEVAPRPGGETVVVGALALDVERIEVRWKGAALTVTVSEFRLIEALARRPGVVFTRERLLERMRGDDSVVAERIIDTYVKRLRRKFEALDPDFGALETVVGAGYRWRG